MKTETIRHSLAHILAYAVQELFPGVKFGIGPAIENGFYYDFDTNTDQHRLENRLTQITEGDLHKIEKKMKEIIKQGISFKKEVVSKEKAKEIFKSQPYKLELIEGLPGKTVSLYKSGGFTDLCKGPHVKSTKEIPQDSFKLTRIAGAYWRGSERNPQLSRIYGIGFQTKKELETHLLKEVEAEKRDHRVLGQKMDLFHIDDEVGPGLILWHPKGAILKKIIMDYALREYLNNGYQLVDTPHIAKINLWKTSGHLDFYKENMMPPLHMAEMGKEEKDDYQIKPMNCPFHIAIYKTKIRSYKDLPIRYTEMGTVYRYERSGTLHGLVRVRQITQDDAHIICTPKQLADELFSALKLTKKILKDFGFKDFSIYLSTRPEKFVGTPKIWQKAENALQYALKKLKLKYQTDAGGGAFYGPKIDIKIKDSLDREWQCTTIQLDFNLPERFEMTYIDEKGKKQRPIMIHRALLGAMERFIGILLEYYGGALPLWLAPVQIWVIPVGNQHKKYAKEVYEKLQAAGFRSELKDEAETVSKKIREGEVQKIPYLLVVGDKEMKSSAVRARSKNKDLGIMKLTAFIKKYGKLS
ncbi:MAG: threonine--tRNA ligase [Parcubacteria group bacterium CG1_02_39_15]|nr:MAG: threonine--tRNA ligase [Parcubacteria group bacterium CG1_02_39_15]